MLLTPLIKLLFRLSYEFLLPRYKPLNQLQIIHQNIPLEIRNVSLKPGKQKLVHIRTNCLTVNFNIAEIFEYYIDQIGKESAIEFTTIPVHFNLQLQLRQILVKLKRLKRLSHYPHTDIIVNPNPPEKSIKRPNNKPNRQCNHRHCKPIPVHLNNKLYFERYSLGRLKRMNIKK